MYLPHIYYASTLFIPLAHLPPKFPTQQFSTWEKTNKKTKMKTKNKEKKPTGRQSICKTQLHNQKMSFWATSDDTFKGVNQCQPSDLKLFLFLADFL